jgi:hypothetical protein
MVDRDDLRFMTIAEFAARESISVATAKRLIRGGRGPQVTELSTRRIGIRIDHYRQYCNSRVRKAKASKARKPHVEATAPALLTP